MSNDLRPHDAALERLKTLHPQLIDLSLGRTERLLDALGRPQDKMAPVIHVAGTNGKGSTVAFLRSITEAAGMTVHVLTSPHLVRFVERIRIAGRLIEEAALAQILERVEAANAGQPITFFEITTVAALVAFAETPADLCLIEVGLGGRFDATNVINRPAVSVITPIDYDHQDFLGSEISRIAWEKAGIIKAGRPVVVAHQSGESGKDERTLDHGRSRLRRLRSGGAADLPEWRGPPRPAAAEPLRRASGQQRRGGGRRGP
jgi:dihydrofolate synthase/folylpolyglutamate synthase